MAVQIPKLNEVEKLSPRVFRILGGNPGKFTLQGTNTYLVGTGPKRILIDTAQGFPAWKQSLSDLLKVENATISQTLITHWHPDHVLGIPSLREISPGTPIYKNDPDEAQLNIDNGQIFHTEGATLRAFHCPGHTTDHMAFVLEEEDAMFTGDNVLGHGTAVFEDLSQYLSSLDAMKNAFSGKAYPGHGVVVENGKARIDEYIAHRKKREDEVLQALTPTASGAPMSSMDVVKVVYKDVAETLHIPAQGGVLQVLAKLRSEGKVVETGEKYRLADRAAL